MSAFKGGSAPTAGSLQRHLENARKSRILQLKSVGLKQIPVQLEEVAEILRHLDFSSNRIQSLPPFIGRFSALKQLHLSGNQLTALPEELGDLQTLETLSVDGNALTELPSALARCNALKTLNAANNRMERLPLVVCQLPQLEVADLSHNRITAIPDEIADMRVVELNLNNNGLASLSPALAKCERLRVLRVEENCLAKTEFSRIILETSGISLIAYAGNLFADKDFQDLPGYDAYQERFTATKRKGV
jgi:Leucine-rich repeat (LRR) protein